MNELCFDLTTETQTETKKNCDYGSRKNRTWIEKHIEEKNIWQNVYKAQMNNHDSTTINYDQRKKKIINGHFLKDLIFFSNYILTQDPTGCKRSSLFDVLRNSEGVVC